MHVLSIDSVHCQDAHLVGAKAAHLARARSLGFPVPDAVVLPCSLSEAVLTAAAAQIASSGVHAGRLAVMAADPALFAGLPARVRQLGEPLVVRSSSPSEADPRLAGAFASFLGVSSGDLATAILGVWSSALQESRSRTGNDDDRPEIALQSHPVTPMGVIIQRELDPDFAGCAHVTTAGDVRVIATAGSAAGLMAGWESGVTATVAEDGLISGDSAISTVGVPVLAEVAGLARSIRSALGDTLIEWAYASGEIWLLQSRKGAATEQSAGPVQQLEGMPLRIDARCLASAIYPAGELAEQLMMPWSVAYGRAVELGSITPHRLDAPAVAWRELRQASLTLVNWVWQKHASAPVDLAARLARTIEDGGASIARDLDQLVQPKQGLVDEFMHQARRLAAHLRSLGLIRTAADFWALPMDLGDVLERERPTGLAGRSYRAALKWEPLLYLAAVAAGEVHYGKPVVSGISSGPATFVDVAGFEATVESNGLPPRSVLVAARPLPRYAPLLMGASGLVTKGGSEAAHLIEVARALGIPAVIGCDLDGVRSGGSTLVAVDGRSGAVHVLDLEH